MVLNILKCHLLKMKFLSYDSNVLTVRIVRTVKVFEKKKCIRGIWCARPTLRMMWYQYKQVVKRENSKQENDWWINPDALETQKYLFCQFNINRKKSNFSSHNLPRLI